jgi:putative transposase
MAHTFTNLLSHIIFGTSNHRPIIDAEWRGEVHAYIGGIVREIGGTALAVNGIADHVHIIAKLPPTVATSDAVRLIKTNSSKWIREGYGRRSKFGWQKGFSAFSVSESALASVLRYVQSQEEHHRKKTFAEESIEFLVKNGIPYVQRYVFE